MFPGLSGYYFSSSGQGIGLSKWIQTGLALNANLRFYSFILVELDIQASEKLPIFLTDFSQSLLNRDFPETWLRLSSAIAAFGLFLERDCGFKDKHHIIARGADSLHRLVDLLRLVDRVIDGFAQLADQFFQVLIQDFTSQLQTMQSLILESL